VTPVLNGKISLLTGFLETVPVYFEYTGIMETFIAVQKLAALANETRLDVFRLLVQAGEEGARPTELASELEVPMQTLSFHLKELLHAELVHSERQGRSIFYRADLPAATELLEFIATSCCEVRPKA
jgi:ArsR family transcriptional regulator, arsenate/arsenite/antimonite-responsive transcriptional repressor